MSQPETRSRYAGRPLREVYVSGIGSFSPGEPVPFDQIEDVLGSITKAPPQLVKRINRIRSLMKRMLGIEYSHYAWDTKTQSLTETNATMAAKASRKALAQAGLEAAEIDLLVYAGVFYDYMCPPTSVFVQEELNISYCAEISIHSNCTSIYKAIQIAADAVANGRYDRALIVTSQLSSPLLLADYFNQDVITEEQAILRWFLSDGAGAMVVTADPPPEPCLRVLDTYLESVGVGIEPSMHMLIGGARSDPKEIIEQGWHHLSQDLKVVAELAIKLGAPGVKRMLDSWDMDLSKVRCFFLNVPTKHMMNEAIKSIRKVMEMPNLSFYTKLGTRGYPGPPAILIALDEYLKENSLDAGDQLVSFVTESSKWMHAGFVLEQTATGKQGASS